MSKLKPIPYAVSSYKTIRQRNHYYLDKTHYIPQLETAGDYLFLIRPRRFGKSSLLTVLECYYYIARVDDFDFFFQDTHIGQQPTPEKNAYLILKFNFSRVNPQLDQIEESFNGHTYNMFALFGQKYAQFLDEFYFKTMDRHRQAYQKLEFLLDYLGMLGHTVYVLIDEYDNFANTILTTAGQQAYRELTHGAGFFRFFFNILKGATDQVDTGLGRLFITGVSPVTMDDLTSGFNIGTNITLQAEFNELLGFTEVDVREMLGYYQHEGGLTLSSLDETLALMRTWYDNYRFASQAETTLFNSDMVLYFIRDLLRTGQSPEEMIDQNVRIDYGKLRHLLILGRQLNGNFRHLLDILEEGRIEAKIVSSFPVERLTKSRNFLSLLFYFGLLSYRIDGDMPVLSPPNETVKQLLYSYLRDGYEDAEVFTLNLWRLAGLIRGMAYRGDWQPVFNFLAAAVQEQTAIRDFLKGEKVIQTFLLAYLNVTDYYLTRTEVEMGKGFVDLYLQPFWAKYDDIPYTYLIELKYLTKGQGSEEEIDQALTEAESQLQQYATDARVVQGRRGGTVICVALVFCGWELVRAEGV